MASQERKPKPHGMITFMLRIKLNLAVENCFALNCTLRSFVLFPQIKEMHREFKTVFIYI